MKEADHKNQVDDLSRDKPLLLPILLDQASPLATMAVPLAEHTGPHHGNSLFVRGGLRLLVGDSPNLYLDVDELGEMLFWGQE